MTWFRNPRFLSTIIFLLLIGLVWFAGPSLGLESREARFAGGFLVMLAWVAILLVGQGRGGFDQAGNPRGSRPAPATPPRGHRGPQDLPPGQDPRQGGDL